MSGAAGNRNRAISHAVRNLVSGYLGTEGFETTPKPYAGRISDSFETALEPDIQGLPGVHLDVSSRLQHRLADDLDSARRAGAVNGTEVSAFVQYRAERPIPESYVIVGLDHFAKLLRAAQASP
ncbi:hypothetical protein [Microbacterium thalli]|uniref:hypothetical protein n=1 Tax=Microbacterium thalli TaxID=3027921 RepID=UPI0023663D98|nr:hypothetical protein [Microbacterium thalli]MDD7929883.1 hypothetical protein [Microbacterium thalli]